MSIKRVDFEDGKIARNIAQIAFPMLVAQIVTLLYSIVDRIYIGRIPEHGTDALGGIGICFPVIIIITGFANMYGTGGSPLFSMELGSGNKKNADCVMNTAFRLICVTSVVIMVIGELFTEPMLRLFGATGITLEYALVYLRIYLLGTLFSMMATGMNPYINAQGFPRAGMISVVIGALSNLILDPIFIFGMDMGVAGAALATIISQGLSALYAAGFIFKGPAEYKVHFEKQKCIRDYFPFAGRIIGLGTSSFIMNCTNSFVQIACNSVLIKFGGEIYVSIMTIITSVRQILDTPVTAVIEGASPIISYNYGARRALNIKKAMTIMILVSSTYTLIVWLLIRWKPMLFISIFSADEGLQHAAVPALHLYFYAYIFQALQYSGQAVFKALNKKKQTIFFSLFRKVIMVIPLTFILPYALGLGTDGVFMAEPISNLIGGVACFTTMLSIVIPELKRMNENA